MIVNQSQSALNRSVIIESSHAKESILNHILVHLLDQYFIVLRSFELGLIDPVESLEASPVEILNVYHRSGTGLAGQTLHLCLQVSSLGRIG